MDQGYSWKTRLKRAASIGVAGTAILAILALGLALLILYFLIRFIHWAWIH
jgi:hypothetical protein